VYFGAQVVACRITPWYTHLAVAGATPEFGRVEVTWNGNPVTNLQFCNIEFENESGRDFTDVEVKFWFNDGTQIHGQGALQQTAQVFPYTASFQNRIDAAFAPPPAPPPPANEINQLLSRRESKIPVLNRGGRFLMTFVVHPGGNAHPVLEVYCDHPGVRLVHRTQRQMFLGVVQTHAAWVGLVAALVIWLAVGMVNNSVLFVSTIAFLVGAVGTAIGAGLIHLKRIIGRTIG
jgi:hypothetical protein